MAHVRAPELTGRGGWINTAAPLSMAELRGKIVILDFWTFCCVNCLHVLDELRPLEDAFAEELVIIGVHSPKFAHEADHGALVAACERYGVHHPVLDDPELSTWKQYAVRAWPTLAVIDPEGYVVAQFSGEGHAHALEALLKDLVTEHEAKGTLRRGDSPYVAPVPAPGLLRFPARAVPMPDGTVLVADTGHHRIVRLAADLETPLQIFGSGSRGFTDGAGEMASFSEPNGLCLVPPDEAADLGFDVVVADTVNHALRTLNLTTGDVRTAAGTGAQWMARDAVEGPGRSVPLSSPWDVAWVDGCVQIAMAGIHQLWLWDPHVDDIGVLAGTTNEGLVDGLAEKAWLAQTSGLAFDQAIDDQHLWFVDSETSSLRSYNVHTELIHTAIGTGLFDFGHVDGPAAESRLQHPLGLCLLPDGSVAVADTYNGAIRRFDPASREVSTLTTGLSEPSDVCLLSDKDRGTVLLVVETNNHRLVRVPVPDEALTVAGERLSTRRPPTALAAGGVRLDVVFTPPPGQKLDNRYGPSTYVVVESSPPELLASGRYAGTDLSQPLQLAAGAGVLHVSVRAASCDDGDAEYPACHVHQQDWGVPVEVAEGVGADRLTLVLAGR